MQILWLLCLLDITWKFRTLAIFVIVGLRTNSIHEICRWSVSFQIFLCITLGFFYYCHNNRNININTAWLQHCYFIFYRNSVRKHSTLVAMPTSVTMFMPIILIVKISQVAYSTKHIRTRRTRSSHEPDSSFFWNEVMPMFITCLSKHTLPHYYTSQFLNALFWKE
jgi:hypothetical protein